MVRRETLSIKTFLPATIYRNESSEMRRRIQCKGLLDCGCNAMSVSVGILLVDKFYKVTFVGGDGGGGGV